MESDSGGGIEEEEKCEDGCFEEYCAQCCEGGG